MRSGLFKLNKKNWIKALIVAVSGALFMYFAPFFTDGSGKDIFDITKVDLINAGKDALKAGASYIFASLFFNSEGKFLKKEVK